MPLVFRAMRKDEDGLPSIERSSNGLGIRPGIDVDVDSQGEVLANGKGTSVNPNWRDMSIARIPKRLSRLLPGARGSNNVFCFRQGEGSFQHGDFAEGLILEPDSKTHGVIAPAETTPLANYEAALEATRSGWIVDEA